MNRDLVQRHEVSLLDDDATVRRLGANLSKNREQDHTASIDRAAAAFDYDACRAEWWNPPEFSLLHGTPLWHESSEAQRILLNQLYWVAYYAQIISAEIATIVLNQTSAAGLNSFEDFRLVCDLLDLETSQERAHIAAFKKIGEEVEHALFGERIFTYPMRSMFHGTMIYSDLGVIGKKWRSVQLRAFTLLSAGSPFIGCQYFTVRGLRTLNGRMIQHGLAQVTLKAKDRDATPVPSRISYYHVMDEAFHLNSSRIIAHDVIRSLPQPGAFERWVANEAIAGCQRDHFHVSAAVRGLFWYEPALFGSIYKVLRSPHFGLDDRGARAMMHRCFAEENDGVHEAFRLHEDAVASYVEFLDPLAYVSRSNRTMNHMRKSDMARYLATNREALRRFEGAGVGGRGSRKGSSDPA